MNTKILTGFFYIFMSLNIGLLFSHIAQAAGTNKKLNVNESKVASIDAKTLNKLGITGIIAKAMDGDILYEYTAGTYFYLGIGGAKQNYNDAFHWFRSAARKGYPPAQVNIGLMYYKGDGVYKNYKTSLKWFKKAADQDSHVALYNIGVMYYNGDGVYRNYNKAFAWFYKAAIAGNPESQMQLSLMYKDGIGVTKSQLLAQKWLEKAAKSGSKYAKTILKVSTGALDQKKSPVIIKSKPSNTAKKLNLKKQETIIVDKKSSSAWNKDFFYLVLIVIIVFLLFFGFALYVRKVKKKLGVVKEENKHIIGETKTKEQLKKNKKRSSVKTDKENIPHTIKKALKLFDLEEGTTSRDIQQTYNKLIKKYHPDKFSERNSSKEDIEVAKDMTQQINIAYEVLKQACLDKLI